VNNLKPLVGVSQCLLGDAVRYDGKSKANTIVIEQLGKIFKLIAVCPEVEAGLSIPRPPVQLTCNIENPKLTGRDDPSIDITGIMQRYCKTKPAELKHLSGFIFKSCSPSCGLNSTSVFINKRCVTEAGRGIFAKHLCRSYPDLAVIEDDALDDKNMLEEFIKKVKKVPLC
jgi:uncharacterized protein YbbK (DUF523 family)